VGCRIVILFGVVLLAEHAGHRKRATVRLIALLRRAMGDYRMSEILDTISVSPSGWTDFAAVCLTGRRWPRPQ
jgi:hypothetical protein